LISVFIDLFYCVGIADAKMSVERNPIILVNIRSFINQRYECCANQ